MLIITLTVALKRHFFYEMSLLPRGRKCIIRSLMAAACCGCTIIQMNCLHGGFELHLAALPFDSTVQTLGSEPACQSLEIPLPRHQNRAAARQQVISLSHYFLQSAGRANVALSQS